VVVAVSVAVVQFHDRNKQIENTHRKIISQLTTMAHWKVKGHTEEHRVREFDRQTNISNDWEDDTTPKQTNNRGIRTHIKQLIQNEVYIINAMGDGHCITEQ
jgi:hypothetical protein